MRSTGFIGDVNLKFYSVSEGVASVTIKINNKYNMKIVQVYAATCSHWDEEIESFYYDVHLASKRSITLFIIITG